MTELKFETREKKVDELTEYHVFDITGEKEIYAGCVKNFRWNASLSDGGFNRLEPFNANNERLGHGGGEETDVQELIDYVKSVHTSNVEIENKIAEQWETQKEDALRLGTTEEKFKRYHNVRNYVERVVKAEKDLVQLKYILDEIVSAYESEAIASIRTEGVEIVFKEAIDKREKEIAEFERDIEQVTGWIKEY
ncbi:hypothetical protein QUF96_02965 [Bacillus bombysepticus]|uniref:hypothetical protein n=1 Tax=Bacillus anthracis TaxID=1392 RepID=UPI003D1FFC69|nr:hypothetical protein [Bacillus bombysepticus]